MQSWKNTLADIKKIEAEYGNRLSRPASEPNKYWYENI